jgi:uncharacterized protein (DUF1501 family)
MNRREFLRLSALTMSSPFALNTPLLLSAQQLPVLILVELNGGNDSHNTVLDLSQLERYQQLRPQLALKENERVSIDEKFALHHSLAGFKNIWLQGELALVHGLGYPAANKSHFRSIDIWDTASQSDQYLSQGWLADVLTKVSNEPINAMTFGRNANVFAGGDSRHIQLTDLNRYLKKKAGKTHSQSASKNPALSHLLNLDQNNFDSRASLLQGLSKNITLKTQFPTTVLGKQLADVAKVIRMDLNIPAFKVALGSFDTHRGQKQKHRQLLKQLADAVMALRAEMQKSGHWPNVLLMTYSEFGRRAAQNGSGGTDHGTAASHFLMGGRVKGGHYGRYPSFDNLIDRDVLYSTDFRALYQSVVRQWWQQKDFKITDNLANLALIHAS